MPRQKVIDVYTFSELTGTAAEHARLWLTGQVAGWDEYRLDLWKAALDQVGFTDPEITYQLSYCQGDGASFTSGVDVRRLLDYLTDPVTPENRILGLAKPLHGHDEDFRSYVAFHAACPADPRLCRLYAHMDGLRLAVVADHRGTCSVSLDSDLDPAFDDDVKLLEQAAEYLRHRCCVAIYKQLRDDYEAETDDEALARLAQLNDFTFDNKGNYCPLQKTGKTYDVLVFTLGPGPGEGHPKTHRVRADTVREAAVAATRQHDCQPGQFPQVQWVQEA